MFGWGSNFAAAFVLISPWPGAVNPSDLRELYLLSFLGGLVMGVALWLWGRRLANQWYRKQIAVTSEMFAQMYLDRTTCKSPGCGLVNPRDSRYCRGCGTALEFANGS